MKAILTLVAASLAAMALAVSAPAAEYIPGVTDFPSASQSERYVPFVTDFPNRAPAAAPAVSVATANGFDGRDAALGAAVGLALGALAATSLPALSRRRRVSSA